MSFVQRELDKIAVELGNHPIDSDTWQKLYIAQQALAWASDPGMCKAPYLSIMGKDDAPASLQIMDGPKDPIAV